MDKPIIRPVEAFPMEQQDQTLICLRDPSGLAQLCLVGAEGRLVHHRLRHLGVCQTGLVRRVVAGLRAERECRQRRQLS